MFLEKNMEQHFNYWAAVEFLSSTITMKAENSFYSKASESQISYNAISALSGNRILVLYQKSRLLKVQKYNCFPLKPNT